MLEKIVIFILFLGPLVFFHELGHFLFARLFGVTVEVFSIGFGPKILKYKKGETQYAISLIPLGGYVKMFGDDPLNKDAIPENLREKSFTHKGKWARFWIVMGGPLANFILAFVIFAFLGMTGERVPELRLGHITPEEKLYKVGLRSGDILKKVNGVEIYDPSDILLDRNKYIKSITVKRYNGLNQINSNIYNQEFLDGIIKNPPALRVPIVVDQSSSKYFLSLENKVNLDISLEEMVSHVGREIFIFKKESDNYKKVTSIPINGKISSANDLVKILYDKGYYLLDIVVKSVNMKSPADKAGIKANSVIYELEGKPIYGFDDLKEKLKEVEKETVSVKVWENGVSKTFSITPEIKNDGKRTIRILGVYSSVEYLKLSHVNTKPKEFFASLVTSFGRTWDTIAKTIEGFKKLILAEISMKNISGPLAIGKVASDSFNTSLSYFFQLMAIISINLGVINLFPIPVLDGGHIMFIFLEIINRGPISRRKMEIAQQVGLSLLLMLMVSAIFNDFARFF